MAQYGIAYGLLLQEDTCNDMEELFNCLVVILSVSTLNAFGIFFKNH